MPNFQRGKCAGVYGVLSLDNGATLRVKATRWETNLSGEPRAKRGRGNRWVTIRFTFETGTILIEGINVNEATAPAPNAWKQINGTLEFSVFSGKSVSYPVTILSNGYRFDEKKNEMPRVLATAQIIGDPVCDGWTNTPSLPTFSKANQEQYGEGTVKTYDKKGLLTGATRTTDIWTDIQDSDSAESQLLVSTAVAALPPIVVAGQTLKLRTSQFTRNAIDGGIIFETWGLTDSADDILLPINTRRDDPAKLTSSAHSAAINASAPNPAVPHTVLVATDSKKLNDGTTLNEAEYGPRTSKQQKEQDGSQARIDKSLLESIGQDTKVFDTGSPTADATSPHASLKVVATTIQELTADQSEKITYFDVASSAEKIIFRRATTTTDSSALKSVTIQGAVFTTGSEPSAPTVSGLVLRDKEVITLTSPDTSNKSVVFWSFAETTHADDILFEHEKVESDPAHLNDSEVKASLYTTVYSAPSVPSGLKLVGETDIPITDADASNKRLHLWRYGTRNSKDAIEFDETVVRLDPLAADSTAAETQVYLTTGGAPSDPAAPSAELQVVAHETKTIDINYSKLKTLYDVLNSQQKKAFPEVRTDTDPNSIGDTAVRYKFFTHGGTAPTAPDDPPTNNVKLIDKRDLRFTPTQDLRLFIYGPKSTRDEEVLPNTSTVSDPNNLEASATRAGLDGETITDPTGYFWRSTRVIPITDSLGTNRTLTVKTYGLRSTKDDEEMPRTFSEIDLSDIGTAGAAAQVYLTTGGIPAHASAPTGAQLVRYRVQKLNNTLSILIDTFEKDTEKQKLEQRSTFQYVDPSGLTSQKHAAGLDAVPGLSSGFADRGTRTVPVTHDHNLYVREQGSRTTAQDETFGKTRLTTDHQDMLNSQFVVSVLNATGTAPSTPAAPGNTKLIDVTELYVADKPSAVSNFLFRFGKQDGIDELIYHGGKLQSNRTVTDPQGLETVAFVSTINDSAPTIPTGLKEFTTTTVPMTSGLSPEIVGYERECRPYDTKDKIEYEQTFAESNPLQVYKRRTATVVDSTATAAALAASLLTSNLTDSSFESAQTRKLTPTKSLQVITTSGEDKKIHSMSGHTVLDSLRGLPTSMVSGTTVLSDMPIAAFGDTAAKVNVKVLGRSAGGLGFLELIPTFIYRSRGRFAYRRTFVTNDPSTKFLLNLQGRVCNGSFLGFPAHTVMYSHPQVIYTFAIAPAHQLTIDFIFETDNCFFINDGDLLIGRADNFSTGTLTDSKYYVATLFGASNLLRWPTTADFAPFTTG